MKFQRQSKILELIEKEQIDTQEDLSRRLKEWGFSTTQATISQRYQGTAPCESHDAGRYL